jgi:hypothetical protein
MGYGNEAPSKEQLNAIKSAIKEREKAEKAL